MADDVEGDAELTGKSLADCVELCIRATRQCASFTFTAATGSCRRSSLTAGAADGADEFGPARLVTSPGSDYYEFVSFPQEPSGDHVFCTHKAAHKEDPWKVATCRALSNEADCDGQTDGWCAWNGPISEGVIEAGDTAATWEKRHQRGLTADLGVYKQEVLSGKTWKECAKLCLRSHNEAIWRVDTTERYGCSAFVTQDQSPAGAAAACTLYNARYDALAFASRTPPATGSADAGVTLTPAAASDTYQLILYSQAVRNTKKTSALGVSDLIYDHPLACTHTAGDEENIGVVAVCRAHGRAVDPDTGVLRTRNSRTECLAEQKADGSSLCQFNAWHFDGSDFETASWNKQVATRLVASTGPVVVLSGDAYIDDVEITQY